MIAAGAVVTNDVPSYALMVGVPAKQVGWICQCGEPLKDNLKCNKCGTVYVLEDQKMKVKI
jgi:UDP-2-acetamido-3-amino-2,3-dideoxy-glucuronate N-acetyltransferase